MDEKRSTFTVTDRRKFTLDGDRREDAAVADEPVESEQPQMEEKKPAASDKVVTMPSREEPPAPVAAGEETEEEELNAADMPQFSALESAEQNAAYQESSRHLDEMLRQANPGMEPQGEVSFEHVIQSFYVSAMLAMGAGTEPGQKPRIDIVGGRQSIDMLALLQDKTKGNLTEREEAMLRNVLFELRMMFLEITNAIAQSAQRPAEPRK